MNNEIDLGESPMKEEPMPVGPDGPQAPQETMYPELRIENSDNPDLMNLPDHGESVIRHTVVHKGEHTHKKGKRYSVHLKVHSIRPTKHISKKSQHSEDDKEDEKAVGDYFKKKGSG